MTLFHFPDRLRSADLWAGVLVILVGGIGLKASFDIFVPLGLNDYLGSRAFPITVSVLLLAAGVSLVVRTMLRPRPSSTDFGSIRMFGTVLGITAAYLMLFAAVGFLVATSLFLLALFVYLGERRLWLALTVALTVTVAIWLAFSAGLNVALPTSPFGF